MPEVFADLAQAAQVSGGLDQPTSGTSETITVSGCTLPAVNTASGTWCYVRDPAAVTELIQVTACTGPGATSITVTRGAGGTSTVTHASGWILSQVVSAPALNSFPQGNIGMFGDGSDGAVTLDGSTAYAGFSTLASSVYTLTRDVYATALTINSGVTLAPNGFRVFCQGTVTNNGTISVAGGNGTAAGAAGSGGGASGTVMSGGTGGAGATAAGTAAANNNSAGLNTGGVGGTGTSGAGGAGGTAGTSGISWFKIPDPILAGITNVLGTNTGNHGGPGGGGGGGDGTNKGGGGGGGGGVIAIFAWVVNNAGTMTAAGGTGGTPTAGNTGGGGGGSGGLILIYTLIAWTAGTTSVAGGAAGSPHGTGTNNAGAGGTGTVLNQVLT